jgi:S1-C subfamily serine protease
MISNHRVFPLFFLVFSVTACASTSITSVVSPKAPVYGAGQILVVAAYSDLGWRTDVEMGFQNRHPAFVASVQVLDVDQLNDAEAIFARITSDAIIDAILFLGAKGSGLSQSFLATEYYTGTISKPWAKTYATLFDEVDAKIVWQADASTRGNAYASWSDVRKSFIGKIVDQLEADGLLNSGPPLRRPKPAAPVSKSVPEVEWRQALPTPTEVIELSSSDFNPIMGPQPLLDRVRPAIVRIEGTRGLGTAFVITRQGLALTNHHVVSGHSQLLARFADNRTAAVRIVRSDEESDIALIQIYCEPDCFTLPIGSERDVSSGTEIYALGHPAGLTASVTRGIVSGIRRAGGVTLLQIDAALNAGNSGGPILDLASGKAIAVVSFKLSETEGLGFAVAIDDALRVLGVRLW